MPAISAEEMFPGVLEILPAFQPKWDAFVEEWKNDKDDEVGKPYYLALAALAHFLIEMLEARQEASLRRVFELVENWHTDGDAYVREAATVGLLEDLQNENLHRSTRPDDFLPYLLPETAYWWDRVLDFWKSGTLIADYRGQ
jgi:hypothetical protein